MSTEKSQQPQAGTKKPSFPMPPIAQVCLVVKDLDKTVENYWRIFGVGPWTFYTYGKPLVKHMTRNGEPTEYAMRVALSNIGPLRIELIQPIDDADTVYREFIEQHGYGVHHFGVLVENMQEALEKAREAGFTMTQDGAGFGLDGDGHYAYLDTEDTIGVTVELIERPKGRQTPEKVYPAEEE
jgi:catechol 2,3-dioxygenase-like lactoylglutathione lyase family enzyme